MKWVLGLVIALFVLTESVSAAPVEGVAWGTSRASARRTCFANTPGGVTVVRRGLDGTYYGTRAFGPGAYWKAATASRRRAMTGTRGHLR